MPKSSLQNEELIMYKLEGSFHGTGRHKNIASPSINFENVIPNNTLCSLILSALIFNKSPYQFDSSLFFFSVLMQEP